MVSMRSALAGICVVELVTLLALAHYSHKLHGLQGKRSLLALQGQNPPSPPNAAAGNQRLDPGGSKRSSPLMQLGSQKPAEEASRAKETGDPALAEAQRKQEEVRKGIQELEAQIRSQQQQENQHAAPPSALDQARDGHGNADKDQDGSLPLSAQHLLPSGALQTADVAARLGASVPATASLSSSISVSSLPAPGGLAAAGSPGTVEASGVGEYEVLWHDGALHAKRFDAKEAATAFYDSLDQNVAHRLAFQGVEIKRLVWADGPWPSEWIPASPFPLGSGRSAGSGENNGGGSTGSPPSISMLEGGGWMKAGGGGGTQNSLLRQKSLASSLTRSGLGSPDSGIGVAGDGGAGWGLDRYQGMDPNGGRRTRVGGGKDADGAAGGGKLIDVSAGRVPQAQGKLAASIGAGAGLTGAGVEGHREVLGGRAQPSSAHLAKPDAAAVSKIHRAPKGQYVLRTETRVGRADIAMDDVSISTHLSCDRMERLESYFRRWQGPIVAALYIKDAAVDEPRVLRLQKMLKATGRENYHFILVYPTDASIYPANLVRNLALEPVRTNFVFLLDIDLIPDVGFYPYVMGQLPSLAALADSHMFTIPAFQGLGSVATVEAEFPVDKDDLIKMVDDKRVKPILSGENEFWQAFSCLNYDKWYTASEMFLAEYRWPCEPYLLGMTKNIPLYDERFVHYGNDKAQHVLNIFYQQYRFGVLPGHFLLHWTHALAEWAGTLNDKKRNEHLGEIMELTEQFKFESGTEAGVNWHTGVKFAPGTYRVKNGVKIVWNGKQWINEATGAAADPLL